MHHQGKDGVGRTSRWCRLQKDGGSLVMLEPGPKHCGLLWLVFAPSMGGPRWGSWRGCWPRSAQTRDSVGIDTWVANTAEEVISTWHSTEGDVSGLGLPHPAAGVGALSPPEPEPEGVEGEGSRASGSGLASTSTPGHRGGFLENTAHVWPDGTFSTRDDLVRMERWDLVAHYNAS